MVVVMAADHAHEQAKQQEPAEGRKHALSCATMAAVAVGVWVVTVVGASARSAPDGAARRGAVALPDLGHGRRATPVGTLAVEDGAGLEVSATCNAVARARR
jgi:hypothetical protein